jgi:hypothetical protein
MCVEAYLRLGKVRLVTKYCLDLDRVHSWSAACTSTFHNGSLTILFVLFCMPVLWNSIMWHVGNMLPRLQIYYKRPKSIMIVQSILIIHKNGKLQIFLYFLYGNVWHYRLRIKHRRHWLMLYTSFYRVADVPTWFSCKPLTVLQDYLIKYVLLNFALSC